MSTLTQANRVLPTRRSEREVFPRMARQNPKQGWTLRSTLRGLGSAFLLSSVALAAFADEGRFWRIEGKAITGPNDVCGVPQWMLPAPFGLAHFTLVGEYDPQPGATDVIRISPTNCDPDILLASTVDPAFQAFLNIPDPDARLKNLPLRKVWTIAGFDGVRAQVLPFGSVPPNPLPATRNSSDKPITLGDWLSAKATLELNCSADGSATVKAHLSHLIPNGLYGLYGLWKTKLPGSTKVADFLPVALGGFPSTVTASATGEAVFTRQLNYCPKDPSPDGSVMMMINVAYHSNGIANGPFPFTTLGLVKFRDEDGTIFESTQPPGTVIQAHLAFPVNVGPINP